MISQIVEQYSAQVAFSKIKERIQEGCRVVGLSNLRGDIKNYVLVVYDKPRPRDAPVLVEGGTGKTYKCDVLTMYKVAGLPAGSSLCYKRVNNLYYENIKAYCEQKKITLVKE